MNKLHDAVLLMYKIVYLAAMNTIVLDGKKHDLIKAGIRVVLSKLHQSLKIDSRSRF